MTIRLDNNPPVKDPALRTWLSRLAAQVTTTQSGFTTNQIRSLVSAVKGAGTGVDINGEYDPMNDHSTPTAPSAFTIETSINDAIMSWSGAEQRSVSHAEIWRSETDDLETAELTGTATGWVYGEYLGPGRVRYYWIRFVSYAGVYSPWSSLSGTRAETPMDPSELLALLEGEITRSQLHQILSAEIDDIQTAIDDLETVYGDTESAAQSAADAAQSASEAAQAEADALVAQGAAEAARDQAGVHATASETHKLAAESARDDAEGFAAASSTSETNAQTYAGQSSSFATVADNARLAAEAARDAANTSATASADSATEASGYANDSEAAATVATNQKLLAEAARDDAEQFSIASNNSSSTAASYATDSETAATAATNAQLAAESARDDSEGFAAAANSSAGTATTKATEASSSASAANTAKLAAEAARDAAGTSATASANSATSASGFADDSEASAQASETSRLAAESARDDSEGFASAANTSAGTATTKATEAGNSASAANVAKLAAETARDDSEGFANAAALSASTAEGHSDDAGDFAAAAQSSATSAGTSASNAATFRDQASQSATDAQGFANAAATDYTAVNARLDNFDSSGSTVEQILSATASTANGIEATYTAQWSIKTQINDISGGVGFYNDGSTTQFMVHADTFSVYSPGSQSLTFAISGGKVVMDGASIKDATITDAKVSSLAATKISGMDASFILARIGTGNITNAYIGGTIQSNNFVSGSSGWSINKSNGSAEFRNIIARGDIKATSIEADAILTAGGAIGAAVSTSTTSTLNLPKAPTSNGTSSTLDGLTATITIPSGYSANVLSKLEAEVAVSLEQVCRYYLEGDSQGSIYTEMMLIRTFAGFPFVADTKIINICTKVGARDAYWINDVWKPQAPTIILRDQYPFVSAGNVTYTLRYRSINSGALHETQHDTLYLSYQEMTVRLRNTP